MNPLRILVIDDEEEIRFLLEAQLVHEGYEVATAESGRIALSLLESQVFDAVLLDIHMADMTGIEVLEAIRSRDQTIDAVMMTGYPQMETAIQALRLGAYDYLMKPLDRIQIRHVFKRIVERRYLQDEITSLRTRLGEAPPDGELVGVAPLMLQVRDTIAKVAPTDSVVLIEGESGTGKELIAGAIHRLSARQGAFVPVNCSAIPAELIESELFGHVKGAFSSASADSKGLFRSADGGTLFLDEVGDMPLQLQPKLLRVLQEKELRPVGSSQTHKIDVRVVAATNHNLESDIHSGKFRQDLFYRLNVVRIEPPSLRQIKEDIPLLVINLIRKFNRRFGRQVQSVTPEGMAALMSYDFPGNVRELENLIERAYALGANGQLTLADLPSLKGHGFPTSSTQAAPMRRLEDLERELISEALRAHGNNREEAAKVLGVSERTLYRRIKTLGLP